MIAPAFTRLSLAVLATAGLVACADAGYEQLSGALCDDLPPSLKTAGVSSPTVPQTVAVGEEAGTSAAVDQPFEALDTAPAVFVIDEFVTSAGQTTSF